MLAFEREFLPIIDKKSIEKLMRHYGGSLVCVPKEDEAVLACNGVTTPGIAGLMANIAINK